MASESTLTKALDRMLRQSNGGGFSAEHARYVLSLNFTAGEHTRFADLSERVQTGTMSSDDQGELDALVIPNALIGAMHSKARVSLRPQQQPAA